MTLELAEVQSVAIAPPAQVGTKKIDEKAFFDVSSSSLRFSSFNPLN